MSNPNRKTIRLPRPQPLGLIVMISWWVVVFAAFILNQQTFDEAVPRWLIGFIAVWGLISMGSRLSERDKFDNEEEAVAAVRAHFRTLR